jgi:hypothetical protein
VATFLAVTAGTTALAWALLFVLPTVFNPMISVCLAFAWLAAGQENRPYVFGPLSVIKVQPFSFLMDCR